MVPSLSDGIVSATLGPSVGSLAVRREVLSDELLCLDVDHLFRSDPRLRSLVVSGPDGPVRLVNRVGFYQELVGPKGYGWALHAQKPVRRLSLVPAMTVDWTMPAVTAGLELMANGASPDDDILVTGGEAGCSTLSVAALFTQVAQANAGQALRFETVLQNLSDVVVLVDAAGLVRYLTASYGRLTGDAIEDRIGRPAFNRVHPDDLPAANSLLATVKDHPGTPHSVELRLMAADGTWKLAEVVAVNLLDDPRIGTIVLTIRDITDKRSLEEQLRNQALHDALTGLANRAHLIARIDAALSARRADDPPVALLYVDLDGFKTVNDVYGHPVGDRLLRVVASSLASHVRAHDTVARIGGDEFVILVGSGSPDLEALAARVHMGLDRVFNVVGEDVVVRASVVIATSDPPVKDPDELIKRADQAMYGAKHGGGNRSMAWSPEVQHRMTTTQELSLDLYHALERQEMYLHFQPIVTIPAGRVIGAEALLRWDHPTRGLVPPAVFIPLAERNGAITTLTRWVLETACRQGVEWMHHFDTAIIVAANVSASEFVRADLVSDVATILATTGFPPAHLELEITETALITNFDQARDALNAIRTLGVRVAIDDFGTGYSSLNYLDQLSFDRIKIDKSFVDRLRTNRDDPLVRGMINLAHSLELQVTAEGIEYAEQADALASMGCDQAQGFFYARPGPPELLHPARGLSPNVAH